MTSSDNTPTPPATDSKRPYVAPALITHGSARTLTHGPKTGSALDTDGTGSFNPPPDGSDE